MKYPELTNHFVICFWKAMSNSNNNSKTSTVGAAIKLAEIQLEENILKSVGSTLKESEVEIANIVTQRVFFFKKKIIYHACGLYHSRGDSKIHCVLKFEVKSLLDSKIRNEWSRRNSGE